MRRVSAMKSSPRNTCPTRRTNANYYRSNTTALLSRQGCSLLLPIRAFEKGALPGQDNDGVMVRTDGCYVAGYQLGGSLTYFGDDAAMNDMNARVEALIRAVPEESMRIQFRYEVIENANGLIDRYEALQRTESELRATWIPSEWRDGEKKKRTASFSPALRRCTSFGIRPCMNG